MPKCKDEVLSMSWVLGNLGHHVVAIVPILLTRKCIFALV